MRKTALLFLFFLFVFNGIGQELNCLVTINSDQIAGSNQQVFGTLQKALTEYINQTKWTNKTVKSEERIDCAMTIIVTSRNDNNFTATLQVQSTRPVYNSSYAAPVLNLKDNEFNFKYNEFDPIFYNKNQYDSNLISTVVFYVYVILGLDADTFALYGGEPELKEAQNAMLQAQQSGIASWQNVVGKQNRFLLIDNLLSSKLKAYRKTLYDYHRKGMDNLISSKVIAQQQIEDSVLSLESIFNKSVGNYLIRVFFDAKSEELVNLYSEPTETKRKQRLLQALKRISPNNNPSWSKFN
ncbi:DUF4835 family protein [uncultured Polaribacter sp.]|uniref:type IX secretion system protein PorD n=1 Tax=uncultured Polaribacter sp. TaxID=174711 RepID=UPI002629315C|nr:DUF4835 family protein [uncultured Polaribacter sp.]